jgi:hypothetical protein
MEHFHFAATILQTTWQIYFAKLNFELDMLVVIIVESAMRRYLARQKVARRRLANQNIQNSARRTLAIRSVQRLRLQCLQQEVIVIVQSAVRRRLASLSAAKRKSEKIMALFGDRTNL